MHNAPAVSHRVARSPFAASFMGLMWVAGSSALVWTVALASQPSQPDWRSMAAMALCLVVGLVALAHWRNSPLGTLRWDRKVWTFTPLQGAVDAPMALEDISVSLDLQTVVLVNFRLSTGRRIWLWLESRNSNREWRVLRRAIHARPKDEDAPVAMRAKPADHLPA